MLEPWALFALAGFLFFAAANIVEKIVRVKYIPHSLSLAVLMGMSDLLILSLMFVLGLSIPPVQVIAAALIAGMLRPIAFIPFGEAIATADISRLAPLFNMLPLFTLVMALLFLGEELPERFLLAFCLMLLGNVILTVKDMRHLFVLDKAFFLMLLVVFLNAVQAIFMKFVYLTEGLFNGLIWISMGSVLMCGFILCFPKLRKTINRDVTHNHHKKMFAVMIVVFFFGILMLGYAIDNGPVSLIYAMAGFQTLFVLGLTLILSRWHPEILKEDFTPAILAKKAVAVILMFAGLMLIYL